MADKTENLEMAFKYVRTFYNELARMLSDISENLEQHQEQLLGYSFQEGVKLAILTNGATWWFYLPLNEGSWEQRRFYTVDLFEQNPADIAKRFVEFLAKERVKSGNALKSAEGVYKSHQKKQILRDAIPKAWIKIISDPDDLLVDLLIETAEKMCGFRPEVEDAERFLKEGLPETIAVIPPPYRPSTTPPVSPLPTGPLGSDYINKRIDYFVFFGKKFHPRSWQDLLLTVSTELYRRHAKQFEKCLTLRGSRMPYFSSNPSELSYPKRIGDSGYYFEAKLNSNSIVRRSRDLMSLFGYKEDDLIIYAN